MKKDEKNVVETVMYYRSVEKYSGGGSMLREVRWQYADMARGGNGGMLWGDDTGKDVYCREYNYPEKPDSFFQEVIDLMGWS